MDGDIEQLVNQTGMCVPLAAQIMRVLAESGASQIEISTALDLVNHLRHHIKGSLVPQDLAASWSAPAPAFEEPPEPL